MAKSKKKEKAVEGAEEQANLHNIASTYAQYVKDCAESDIEAFEAYAHRLQSHIHSHLKDLNHRVDKGYQTLVDILESKMTDYKKDIHE